MNKFLSTECRLTQTPRVVQQGLNRVGVLVPVGRLNRHEAREIADVADKYSGGEVRLTVEQNVILPNVKDEDVTDLLAEPMFGNDKR